MSAKPRLRPRKKRPPKVNEDYLTNLRDELEDYPLKKCTFVIKDSKFYTSGLFWSEKNKRKFVFRSSYEFAFFYQLESDEEVISYIVEPFEIPYWDTKQKRERKYKPDVIVRYRDGLVRLLEIKPKSRVNSREVRAKAKGARAFLAANFPDIKYQFITEEEIFQEKNDYNKLLKYLDPEKHEQKQYIKELSYIKSKLPRELRSAPCMLI